jgi:hypothetical protein
MPKQLSDGNRKFFKETRLPSLRINGKLRAKLETGILSIGTKLHVDIKSTKLIVNWNCRNQCISHPSWRRLRTAPRLGFVRGHRWRGGSKTKTKTITRSPPPYDCCSLSKATADVSTTTPRRRNRREHTCQYHYSDTAIARIIARQYGLIQLYSSSKEPRSGLNMWPPSAVTCY